MAAVINVVFLIIFKQCSYEGCTFKAGRKVLKLHWIQVIIHANYLFLVGLQ